MNTVARSLRNKPNNMVVLTEHQSFDSTFTQLYQNGMKLIDNMSLYLNDEGRIAMRQLSDVAAALYSAEAIRLGSRLMKIASWLLLERALRDGDMQPEYIVQEKKKIKLDFEESPCNHSAWNELPQKFRDFSNEIAHLLERIRYMNNDDNHFDRVNDGAEIIKSHLDNLDKVFDTKK